MFIKKIKFIFIMITIPMLLSAETITEECVLESSQAFGYTGDTQGKRLNTKEEFTYRCSKTTTEQGDCIVWSDPIIEEFRTPKAPQKVYYETEDFSGSMGEMLSIVNAYDKINGLWSGWHGICQTGKDDGNWDWMSDPYTLAGYAMTVVSQELAETAQAAQQSANVAYNQGMQTAQLQQDIATAAAASAKMVNYAVCAARSGLDIAKMVEEYESDGEPCDPVDEFCENEDSANDEQVFTVPEEKYYEMISVSPEVVDYVQIISGQGSGTLQIIVVNPGTAQNDLSMAEAEAALKEIKLLMLKIRGALATIQLAVCVYNATGGKATGGGATDADPLSVQNLSTMALSYACPYCGMALDIGANIYSSLKSIDSCSNESDAKDKGSRHIATYNAKKYDMCHFIEKKDTGSSLRMNDRSIYRYCCYDDKITKIMVEQAKAQLGKDWQHCTDITLNELKFLKFNACDGDALDASGLDGVKMSAYVSQETRFTAYQYVNKCIDAREYMAHMMETFGGEDMLLDDSALRDMMDDLKVE